MAVASPNFVNYAVRPNKAIERKLIFERLGFLAPVFPWPDYRYIGFGAVWFVDFILAHKTLAISDMISIERDAGVATRAEFNRPYACVSVRHGDSSLVLDEMDLEAKPALAWLDYDGPPDGTVLEDLALLCSRAPVGSVVLVTVNAHPGSVPRHDDEGNEYQNFLERMRAWAGDLVPLVLPAKADQPSGYPKFLASLLISHLHREVRTAGREDESMVVLFNIRYQDGAPMVTVGGVIVDQDTEETVGRLLSDSPHEAQFPEDSQVVIKVPPLTLKEKAALDRLLPQEGAATIDAFGSLDLGLRPSQMEAYRRFYRHYPTFGEVVL